MTSTNRRRFLLAAGGAAAGFGTPIGALAQTLSLDGGARWARGIENQRRADLGDGRFLNPIIAGDHPDPSILRCGGVYYMTFSSFDAYPGLLIWRSTDLVNWRPLAPALTTPIGSVWAPDLVEHDGRFFLYIPARRPDYRSIYVVHAEKIEGPWSEPVDLKLPDHIDPGHIVGEDGRRYLFLSGGDMVLLSDDGLSTAGPVRHVYEPWRYPADWDVECFCPEGPKLSRRGDWFYMLTAVGGTAGPPTGHMVVAARSRSVHGPWENAPNNPILRTRSAAEAWWSRGHASLVDGPDGSSFLVYHGYENGYWTLGRQCLLDPVEWTEDGWFVASGGDLSTPLRKPLPGAAGEHGAPLSDDFRESRLGVRWSFYDPAPGEEARFSARKGTLHLKAKGATPADSSPLSFVCGDHAYEVEIDIERDTGARAGLLLFYNRRLYCGLGLDDEGFLMHRYGLERRRGDLGPAPRRIAMRVRNNRHIVTWWTKRDGGDWRKFDVQMEVSGYHHNVAYDFLSLRPAIYAAGEGEARFRRMSYRAL